MAEFIQGQVARISVTISDIAGAVGDPTALALLIQTPGGVVDRHTSDIVKESTGKYHYDLPLVVKGSYRFRWESTGANQGATEDAFFCFSRDAC
jgi:hypothetical protein